MGDKAEQHRPDAPMPATPGPGNPDLAGGPGDTPTRPDGAVVPGEGPEQADRPDTLDIAQEPDDG